MKVHQFIKALSKFNGDLDVTISDGWGYNFYHTNGIEFVINYLGNVDIGIGGCQIEEELEE